MIVLLVINIRNYYKARFNMDLALLSISMIFIMRSYYNEPKWDFRFELLFGIVFFLQVIIIICLENIEYCILNLIKLLSKYFKQ